MLIALAAAPVAHAAAPAVDYLFPAGGQQGTTVSITSGGKIEPWPAKAWTDASGLTIEPAEKNGEFIAKIAKDCPIGPHLVRIYNEQGASAPRIFVVDRHPEIIEKEPNDSLKAAQEIEKLPAIINGQLEKQNDDDCFAIHAEAEQWIVAELTCRRLGSPVDPAMHLYRPDGVEVAFNHDTFGLDPLIAWRAKRAGRYVVQVEGFQYPPGVDVRFAGSKAAVYRLLITTGPYARYAFPAGVQRGQKTSVHLFGWNLGTGGDAILYDFDASSLRSRLQDISLAPPLIHNSLLLSVDDLPEVREIEPNDSIDTAQAIEVPSIVNGRIDHPGDIDRFRFTAKKGEGFSFAVKSAALDFPLDAVLNVEDKAGTSLASVDDVGPSPDPKLQWSAPADGTYFLSISDRFNHGGKEYVYRLEARHPQPDFTAIADAAAVRIEAGKSADLQVTITRQNGHKTPLAVVIDGLPAGVSATSATVPESGGAVKVTIAALPGAANANLPIRPMIVSLDPDHPIARPVVVNLPADQLVTSIDNVWLTVASSPTTKPSN